MGDQVIVISIPWFNPLKIHEKLPDLPQAGYFYKLKTELMCFGKEKIQSEREKRRATQPVLGTN